MAATDAGICNLALSKIGEKGFIDSLTDNTLQAQTCSIFYATCRDALLLERSWPFATRHALLNLAIDQTANAPITRKAWAYVYGVPSDMLIGGARYIDIGYTAPPPESQVPFDLEDDPTYGPILLCNQQSAELVYTRAVTEVGKMDALFQQALAWSLAFELTFAIPNKNAFREQIAQGYMMALDEAASSAFRHQTSSRKPSPSGIRARNGSPGLHRFPR